MGEAKRREERGLEHIEARFSCEMIVNGRRSAWGRSYTDQRAAILDAFMLLVSGHQTIHHLGIDKIEHVELRIFERDLLNGRWRIATVRWVPDVTRMREPVIEVSTKRERV